jgi:hypothetical protein
MKALDSLVIKNTHKGERYINGVRQLPKHRFNSGHRQFFIL